MKKTALVLVVLMVLLAVGCTPEQQFGSGFVTGVATVFEDVNAGLDETKVLLVEVKAGNMALEAAKVEIKTAIGETIANVKTVEEKAKGLDFKDPNLWVAIIAALSGGGIATNIYKNRKKPK